MNNKQFDPSMLALLHHEEKLNGIDSSIFDEKRFIRFVDKTKHIIFEEYIKKIFPSIVERGVILIDENNMRPVTNIEETIIFLWQTYIYSVTDGIELHITDDDWHPLYTFVRNYNVGLYTSDEQSDYINHRMGAFIMLPYIHKEVKECTFSFSNLIHDEIILACQQYVYLQSNINPNIGNDNYFVCLPKTLSEMQLVFTSIVNGIDVSMDRFFNSSHSKAIWEMLDKEYAENIEMKENEKNDEINNLKKNIKEKDEEILSLKSTISSLKNKIESQANMKDDNFKSVIEHNNALQRKIKKLEKINASLIKEKPVEAIDALSDSDVEEEIININYDQKYVFVGFDKNGFQEQVLKHFKNAIFIDTNVNLSTSTYMVIMLTNHITHSIYHGIKEQCKNKNIPFIHCKHSNIELIKELIWNQIND